MNLRVLHSQVALGEDSTRQFKADVHNAESLAAEMAAFANIRNPILVSYIAKGMLPYHGLGSGIKRALEKWPDTAFTDDHDGCLFTATVHRKPAGELALAADSPATRRKSVGKASEKILGSCRENSSITIEELAALIGITDRSVERNIQSLREKGLLRRIGGRKEGHWEVLDT